MKFRCLALLLLVASCSSGSVKPPPASGGRLKVSTSVVAAPVGYDVQVELLAYDDAGGLGGGSVVVTTERGVLDGAGTSATVMLDAGRGTVSFRCAESACEGSQRIQASWNGKVAETNVLFFAVDGGLEDGGVADGGTDGGSVTIGTFGGFDPSQIYLQGTLQEGVGKYALANVTAGNAFLVGPPGARPAWIHPSDGLVYLTAGAVHRFVPDAAPTKEGAVWTNYPKDPMANDPVLPMLPCTNEVANFLVRPGTGKYLHTCAGSSADLRDEAGNVVVTCSQGFKAAGYGEGILCGDMVFDAARVGHTITGFGAATPVAYRAKSDGTFWVATNSSTGFALYQVALDGVATKLYDFAKPQGFGPINADVVGWVNLDALGRLYRWGSMTGKTTTDVIARMDQSKGEIIYDESVVFTKMHGSFMVTGP